MSYLLFFLTSEPPAVAVTFGTLTFIIFHRTWPMSIQLLCTWPLLPFLLLVYPLAPIRRLGTCLWRWVYFNISFPTSLHLNVNSSDLRNSGFLKTNNLAPLLILARLIFLPSIYFLTIFRNYHFPPRFSKVRLKFTSPIWNFLQHFSTDFIFSPWSLLKFSIFSSSLRSGGLILF